VFVLSVLIVLAAVVGIAVWAVLLRLPQADVKATQAVGEELGNDPRVRRFLRSRMQPGVATGLGLTAALIAAIVAGTVIGVIVYMVRRNTGVVGWDLRVATWAGLHATDLSTRVLDLITSLGSTLIIILVSVAAAIYAHLRWRRPSVWLFLLLVVGGQFLVANGIKAAVERVRPAIDPLAGFSGASFPSGHSTAAAATFAAVALVLGRGRSPRVRAALGGTAAGIAVAVGCSRMFLGVHWFSDVLAGLALGWAWFAVCCVAFGGRILRFGAPAEVAAAQPPPAAAAPSSAP
jgi:undecaprenyl-diphosphatase